MQADETGRRRRKDSIWCHTKSCGEAINLCKFRGKCCNTAKWCALQPKPPSSTTPGPVLSQVEAGLETEEVQGDETEEEEMQADETDEMQEDSPWCYTKNCKSAIKLRKRGGKCCTKAKI